jgi:hypothetical protein
MSDTMDLPSICALCKRPIDSQDLPVTLEDGQESHGNCFVESENSHRNQSC